MLAPLLLFAFESPATEFGVYGLASDWFSGSPPPIVDVSEQGCATCVLVRRFIGGVEVRRFKRTRAGISIVPYCPTCYTYQPKE